MDTAQPFLEIMTRYENLLIMLGATIVVGLIGKLIPKLSSHPIGARLQPLAPFVFTMGFCWIPGLLPEASSGGERLMLGLILGWGTGHVHKILKQSVFGEDDRIRG